MRETSREIGRRSGHINKVWGGPYHTSIIASPVYAFHAYKYVYRNPAAGGLCQRVEDYPFSSLQILLGVRRGIIPLEEDPLLFECDIHETLRWLNTAPQPTDGLLLRSALRKRQFELARERGEESRLAGWKSLPAHFVNI